MQPGVIEHVSDTLHDMPHASEVEIDPETAVADVLADIPHLEFEGSFHASGEQGVRRLGQHMLGLLELQDATAEQQAGARIILMNGTSTERQLLFLHDATDVAQDINRGEHEIKDLLGSWDVAQSLIEVGGATSTLRQTMLKASRGEMVTRGEFDEVVLSTLTQAVPHLSADNCASLLRHMRKVEGVLPLERVANAKLLHELAVKVPQAEDANDQVILADTILTGTEALHDQAISMRLHASARRQQREVDNTIREVEALRGQVLGDLKPEVIELCTDYKGALNNFKLKDIISIEKEGVSFESYQRLISFEPRLVNLRALDPEKFEADALKRLAAIVGPIGSEQRDRTEALLNRVRSSQRLNVLLTVDALLNESRLGLGMDNIGAMEPLLNMVTDREGSVDSAKVDAFMHLGDKMPLGSVLQVMRSEEDLSELLTVAERGDNQALIGLGKILQVPELVSLWKEGRLTFYAGAQNDLKEAFLNPMYSQYQRQSEQRQMLVDAITQPSVGPLLSNPVFADGFSDWVSSTMGMNNYAPNQEKAADLNRLVALCELEGVQEALSGIRDANPPILDEVGVLGLSKSGTPESILEKLDIIAQLPPGSIDRGLLRALEGGDGVLDNLVMIQNYGVTKYMEPGSVFGIQRESFLNWFTNEARGNLLEKVQVLSSEQFKAEIETLIGLIRPALIPSMLLEKPVSEWPAIVQKLSTIMSDETFGTLYADEEAFPMWQRNNFLRQAGLSEDGLELVDKLKDLYNNERPLLVTLNSVDHALVGHIVGRWMSQPDQAYLESWKRATTDYPDFWQTISPEGIGYNLRSQLMKAISGSESPDIIAANLNTLFTQERELLVTLNGLDASLTGRVVNHWMRQPDQSYIESWKRATLDYPIFWKFISPEGIGYNLRSQLIKALVNAEEPDKTAEGMTGIFTQARPLWQLNLEIAQWAISSESYHKGMTVEEIPTSLPASYRLDPDTLNKVLEGSLLQPISEMSVEEKRLWINTDGLDDAAVEAIKTVEFDNLQEEARQAALAYRLFETIEISRSEEMRQQATQRNMGFVLSGADIWKEGMLTHFSSRGGLRASLINGNLAGEMIGLQSKADSYPYNVDFVAATKDVTAHATHAERLGALHSSHFGLVAMHYLREPGSFRYGEEFEVPESYAGQHRLLFGGIPTTALSAVSVQEAALIEPLKRDFVRAGIFVPILDESGAVVFSPQEYHAMRRDRNYEKVAPKIIDGAFIAEGSQAGSNEGAEIYIPQAEGDPERWYAKFAQDVSEEDGDDHLWTEYLADSFYARYDPALVPETQMVIIDGRLARISKIADAQGNVTEQGRNRGFIMDVYVGGWDAVYNSANLLPVSNEIALRIDNGNTFDYRATGKKKGTDDTEPFGDVVSELEFGVDADKLHRGMRQKYPGLTEDDIRRQLKQFRERITDKFIDTAIERTRRSRADREFLKQTAKSRRDYIVNYFRDPTA